VADTGRSAAYADLLQALIAVRSDPATARFDVELARAEADGRLDGPTARALRWWQRETLRGLTEHLAEILPDVLDRLADADDAAREAVRDSEQSWQEATRSMPASAIASGDGVSAPTPHSPSPPSAAPHSAAPHSPSAPSAPSAAPTAAPSPERPDGGSHLRPVDPIDSQEGGAATGGPSAPPPPRLLRPGFVPPESAPDAHHRAAPGVPRARLIAGGLTVAGEVRIDRGTSPDTSAPIDPYGLAR
jgi:hypothetical protein